MHLNYCIPNLSLLLSLPPPLSPSSSLSLLLSPTPPPPPPLPTEAILGKIHEAGFQIAMQKELLLSREQAADFYKEHEGRDYFDSLCANMSR